MHNPSIVGEGMDEKGERKRRKNKAEEDEGLIRSFLLFSLSPDYGTFA